MTLKSWPSRLPVLVRVDEIEDDVDALLLDAERRDLGVGGRIDQADAGGERRAAPSVDAAPRTRRDLDGVRGQKMGDDLEIARVADFGERRAGRQDLLALATAT